MPVHFFWSDLKLAMEYTQEGGYIRNPNLCADKDRQLKSTESLPIDELIRLGLLETFQPPDDEQLYRFTDKGYRFFERYRDYYPDPPFIDLSNLEEMAAKIE